MDITGEGFKERSPAMLFNFNGENGTDSGTTWELLFTEGVYFKTEGGDNEDENPERVNGIQPDGIRDFSWIQTPAAVGHTHTLTAKKENLISVSGNTSGTSSNHYHTLTNAINGNTGADNHNHEGTISMTPNEVVVSAPSTTSRGVGPVIEPVPEVLDTDGEWGEPNGDWSDPIEGSPPNEEGWDYEVISTGTPGGWELVGDFRFHENYCTLHDWNNPPCEGHDGYYGVGNWQSIRYQHPNYIDGFYWECTSREINPNNGVVTLNRIHIIELGSIPSDGGKQDEWVDGNLISYSYILERSGDWMVIREGTFERVWGTSGTYKRRTKTWIPGDNGTPEIPGSGSVNAVSSVNTSFTSFTVNTTDISLGGDGSHSHTISIPTSGSSNGTGHTHTISASGIADINVSGSTISGGAHSHTFDFTYSSLSGAKIASETTVKNRKMRIWRRTA
jgi:hypothetical protein